MFGTIFKMYPELERVMLSEAFSRYMKNVRKPCQKARKDKIDELNKKILYSKITTEPGNDNPLKSLKKMMQDASNIKDQMSPQKVSAVMNKRQLYEELLQEFNNKTLEM